MTGGCKDIVACLACRHVDRASARNTICSYSFKLEMNALRRANVFVSVDVFVDAKRGGAHGKFNPCACSDFNLYVYSHLMSNLMIVYVYRHIHEGCGRPDDMQGTSGTF